MKSPNPDEPEISHIKKITNPRFLPECSPIKEFGDKFGRG